MPAAGPWTGYPPELLLGTESGYATAAPYQPLPQPQGMTNDPRAWCRAIYRGDTLSMGLMPDACIDLGYPQKIAPQTLPGFGRMPGTTAAERKAMAEDLGIKGFVAGIPRKENEPMTHYNPPWPLNNYPYPNNTLGPMQATDVGRRSGTQVGCYTKVGRIEIGAIDIGGVEIMGGYPMPYPDHVNVGAVEIMGGYIYPSVQNSGVDVGAHVEGGYVHTAPLGPDNVDVGRYHDVRPPKKPGFWETLFGKRRSGTSVGAQPRPRAAPRIQLRYPVPTGTIQPLYPNDPLWRKPGFPQFIDSLPSGKAFLLYRGGLKPMAYFKAQGQYSQIEVDGMRVDSADLEG